MTADRCKLSSAFQMLLLIIAFSIQFVSLSCAGHPTVFKPDATDKGFGQYSPGIWEEGRTYGTWFGNFRGAGQAGIETDTTEGSITNVLFERPAFPDARDTTHACLVTTRYQAGDFNLTVNLNTVQQYRTPRPNSWEVAWVMWHFVDNAHFYYFILKMNGWEIGKADPAYPGGQRFLRTGELPTVSVGSYHVIQIQQREDALAVALDGIPLEPVTDGERPILSGKFGLYTEDAYVRFGNFRVAY